jgi:acetolactate synthase I/II/III large subunit
MKAAELFVNYLENEGVEYMFGVMRFKNPDFVKYAESFGVKGYRVERAVDLLPSLKQRLADDTVAIVDCSVDYSENMKLTRELEELRSPV